MPRGRPKTSDGDTQIVKVAQRGRANGNGANLGFEAQLFLAADKLRKNLEPSDYKHVALGLIFLKYISNAFEAKRAALLAEDPPAAEDPDEYLAENVFWVPKEARWARLQDNAKQSTIGKLIDDAMSAIEKHNPGLKGVLPKDYNRPALDKVMLGELIDLVSGVGMGEPGEKAKDILGRVYEYFLGGFAGSEGKRGGEFYTPQSVVRQVVEARNQIGQLPGSVCMEILRRQIHDHPRDSAARCLQWRTVVAITASDFRKAGLDCRKISRPHRARPIKLFPWACSDPARIECGPRANRCCGTSGGSPSTWRRRSEHGACRRRNRRGYPSSYR